MKSIYLNGRIYEGVTPASFGRADHWNTESEEEHLAAEEAYFNHIESFPSYPCPSPHPFKDGEDVSGRYEVENICNSPHCDCMNGRPSYCRKNSQGKSIAVPL